MKKLVFSAVVLAAVVAASGNLYAGPVAKAVTGAGKAVAKLVAREGDEVAKVAAKNSDEIVKTGGKAAIKTAGEVAASGALKGGLVEKVAAKGGTAIKVPKVTPKQILATGGAVAAVDGVHSLTASERSKAEGIEAMNAKAADAFDNLPDDAKAKIISEQNANNSQSALQKFVPTGATVGTCLIILAVGIVGVKMLKVWLQKPASANCNSKQ